MYTHKQYTLLIETFCHSFIRWEPIWDVMEVLYTGMLHIGMYKYTHIVCRPQIVISTYDADVYTRKKNRCTHIWNKIDGLSALSQFKGALDPKMRTFPARGGGGNL